MKKIIIIIISASLLLSACNLPGLGAPEVGLVAQQTVEAELTSLAQEQPSATAIPEVTEELEVTSVPPTATQAGPTPTEGTQGCTDLAAFVSDVTIPDGTDIEPGDSFTKTWRLRNNGSCTWTSSYALVFDHGDAMSGPAAVPLAGAVPPGGTVDLSVNLQAPNSPGTYQGFWLLRNNSGVLFGIGASGTTAFWVKIEVLEPTPTPTEEGIVIITLQPIITLLPLFPRSSGNDQSLADGACFDLDDGVVIGCGSGDSDFSYDYNIVASGFPPVLTPVQEFKPRNGTEIRFFGNSAPTKGECSSMALSGNDLDLDPGDYYCYQTSDGLYGWLKPDSANQFNIVFDWVTFN